MGIYEVLLGIDRAAQDTQRRIKMRVIAEDRLSAAIQAENLADSTLMADPRIDYTHAMQVTPLNQTASSAISALVA